MKIWLALLTAALKAVFDFGRLRNGKLVHERTDEVFSNKFSIRVGNTNYSTVSRLLVEGDGSTLTGSRRYRLVHSTT